jgi:hypothetical protein
MRQGPFCYTPSGWNLQEQGKRTIWASAGISRLVKAPFHNENRFYSFFSVKILLEHYALKRIAVLIMV